MGHAISGTYSRAIGADVTLFNIDKVVGGPGRIRGTGIDPELGRSLCALWNFHQVMHQGGDLRQSG